MKIVAIILAILVSQLLAESKEAEMSSQRLAELRRKSESIKKASSEREVAAILGEPQSKGTGGWANPERKVWHYLSYTDDSQHRSFAVSFDPKTGCFVSQVEISREEVEKSALLVSTGTVIGVCQSYPDKKDSGFLCDVRFNRDGREFTIGVAVATLDRVKGTPEPGASIRVEHRGSELDCIFLGPHSLNLEPIIFTGKGEQVVPSNDGNRPN